ncbi:hypothetical protein C8Q78DRAFT_676536 [Trametes maxima]|nr:hypothetical protein C8Q78DRAFT_676536 [Trametes maxima]
MRRAGTGLATSRPLWAAVHCIGLWLRTSTYGKPSCPERGDVKSVQSSNDPETCPRQHALREGPWKRAIDSPVRSQTCLPPYGSSRSREELRFPGPRNRVVPEPTGSLLSYPSGIFGGYPQRASVEAHALRDQPRLLRFPAPTRGNSPWT